MRTKLLSLLLIVVSVLGISGAASNNGTLADMWRALGEQHGTRVYEPHNLMTLTYAHMAGVESAMFFFGSACVSTVTTGNWAVGANWTSCASSFPGTGDTSTISDGADITIPLATSTTVGSSPADDTGTPAIQQASATGTGILRVLGTLIYQGPLRLNKNTWFCGPGSVWTHDSHLAGVPANAHYSVQIGVASGTAAALDCSTGTSGSHITFNIFAGSGFSGGFHCNTASCVDGGTFKLTYGDFQDCGGPTIPCAFSYANAAGEGILFDHVTCMVVGHGCGQFLTGNVSNTGNFAMTNSTMTVPNVSVGAFFIGADGGGNGFNINKAGGSRDFSNTLVVGGFNQFSSTPGTRGSAVHITANKTIFASNCGASDAVPITGNKSYTWDQATDVMLFNCTATPANPSVMPGGTNLSRFILLLTGNTSNPHMIASINATTTIDTFVAQFEGTGTENGDTFQTETNPTARFPFIVTHGLLLPDDAGNAPGDFINHSYSNCDGVTSFCPQITSESNTYPGTDGGTLAMGAAGEVNTGFAGLYASQRNNVVYPSVTGSTFNAGIGWVTKWHSGVTPVANTFSNADYNACINCTAGIANQYFRSVSDPTEYTITPGAHDIAIATNPFVDPTRKFVKWCQQFDAAVTTFNGCMADIKAGTISIVQVFASGTGFLDYARGGWTPTGAGCSALARNGYDGSTIGAVPCNTPGGQIAGTATIAGTAAVK